MIVLKRILLVLLVTGIIASFAIAIGAALIATRGFFHPGDPLFETQYKLENLIARSVPNTADRADRYMWLANRRMADLAFVTGSDRELTAVAYLDAELNRAAQAVSEVPLQPDTEFRQFVDSLQVRVDALLVLPEKYPKLYAALADKITTLKMLAASRPDEGGTFPA